MPLFLFIPTENIRKPDVRRYRNRPMTRNGLTTFQKCVNKKLKAAFLSVKTFGSLYKPMRIRSESVKVLLLQKKNKAKKTYVYPICTTLKFRFKFLLKT